MNILRTSKLFSAAFLIGIVGASQAATLEIKNISGIWTAADLDPDSGSVTGLNSNKISWGVPVSWRSGQSSYVFNGAGSTGVTLDESFNIGTFTHNNNPIYSPSLETATLKVTFDLAIHDGSNTTTNTYSSVFNFNHWETPNNMNPCPGGSDWNGCFDRVTFKTNSGQTDTFIIDGKEYSFQLTGFLVDGQLADQFWTKEKKSNMATLQGSVSMSAVPIPAAAWLFGSALLGMVGIGYRRRAS